MAAIMITTGTAERRRPTSSPRRHPAVASGRARSISRATYWRRRIAVVVLVIGLVLVMAQAGAALGGSSLAAPERRPTVQRTVVRPGDSLWSVADRLAPDGDPRPVVDALVEARGNASLVPGETVEWGG
jgi:hypothetical protein